MDYIEEQLRLTQPELLVPYREALEVLETDFAMRFSFSALLLREIVRLITRSHGYPKDDVASEHAVKNCAWLPKKAYRDDKPNLLSLRGHLLLTGFRNRTPADFTPTQNAAINSAVDALISAQADLNGKVHGIVQSSRLSEAEGRPLIDDVVHTLAEALRLKRTILDIIEVRTADSVSASISLLDDGSCTTE